MEGEINRTAQGPADLIPVAYGYSLGFLGSGGTSNFHVTSNANGVAKIRIDNETLSTSNIVIVSPYDSPIPMLLQYKLDNGDLEIHGYDTSGNAVTTSLYFSVVIYKQ